jgi:hypothetical protein
MHPQNNNSPIFLSQKDAHLLAMASAKAEMLGLPYPTNPSQAAYLLSIVSSAEIKAPMAGNTISNPFGNLAAISPSDSSSAASFSSAGRLRHQSFSSAPAVADDYEVNEIEGEMGKVQDWMGIESADEREVTHPNMIHKQPGSHNPKSNRHPSNASANSTVYSDTNSIQAFGAFSDSSAILSIGSLSRFPPRSIADIFSSTN